MVRLFYVSTADISVDQLMVDKIADEAALKNASYGITGALGYNGTNFAQILEGEQSDVSNLFELIMNDRRHTGLIVVNMRQIERRIYPDWTMKRIEGLDFEELLVGAIA